MAPKNLERCATNGNAIPVPSSTLVECRSGKMCEFKAPFEGKWFVCTGLLRDTSPMPIRRKEPLETAAKAD